MINPGMKIIQQFKTLVPGITDAKELNIPCYINYPSMDAKDQFFTLSIDEKETLAIHFERADEEHQFFQLTNVFVFSENEMLELAQQFEFDLISDFHGRIIHSAVLKASKNPASILYAKFSKHKNRDFLVIQQINGHTDYDSNYPLIWRVAEVELSEEFKQKLDFHWQNTLKTIHTTTT